MLVRHSDGSYVVLDFRETAPAAASQDMFKNDTNASLYGGLARYEYRLMSLNTTILRLLMILVAYQGNYEVYSIYMRPMVPFLGLTSYSLLSV